MCPMPTRNCSRMKNSPSLLFLCYRPRANLGLALDVERHFRISHQRDTEHRARDRHLKC